MPRVLGSRITPLPTTLGREVRDPAGPEGLVLTFPAASHLHLPSRSLCPAATPTGQLGELPGDHGALPEVPDGHEPVDVARPVAPAASASAKRGPPSAAGNRSLARPPQCRSRADSSAGVTGVVDGKAAPRDAGQLRRPGRPLVWPCMALAGSAASSFSHPILPAVNQTLLGIQQRGASPRRPR
jgi:hypothetical protein